jgi:RHS repeat-associated protein
MKLLFATATTLSLFIGGLLGLHDAGQPTVTSIRAFEEPLIAIGGNSSTSSDSTLITALQTFQHRKSYEDVSALTSYLEANPQSPWKFSLLANLGIIYRKTGHFSRAIDVWEKAWALGKGEPHDIQVQTLANRVLAELSSLLSSLGRKERLESLLTDIKGRAISGSAGVMISAMRENLWLMKNKPGESFKCGPYALDSIRSFVNQKLTHDDLVLKAQSSSKGFSLTQVRDLSTGLKMNYQMAQRTPGADFIVPAVTHWKSGHYAALLKKDGDHYLTKDPTFGQEVWISAEALNDESSGYFLVPAGKLPSGWQPISDSLGNTIWGQGEHFPVVMTATTPLDKQLPPGCIRGMASYNVFLMLISLSIKDNPVGYTPPVGPDMQFTITYNQLEISELGSFTYGNFGPCWNNSWLSFISIPTFTGTSASSATVNIRGGGQEIFEPTGVSSPPTDSRGYTNYFSTQVQSQATLWVNSTHTAYERRFPDGSKEVFTEIDPSTEHAYLTAIVDSKGNSASLNYMTDGSYRLLTVTDALGLSSTISYGLAPSPLSLSNPLTYLVTQITDPYNRSASFGYTNYSGIGYQLTSIQDVIGIQSQFSYTSGSSVISSMTTPYGTTSFVSSQTEPQGGGSTPDYAIRSLQISEPDGSNIRLYSDLTGNNYPSSSTADAEPTGFGFNSDNLLWISYRNTYFWDKKAAADPVGSGCLSSPASAANTPSTASFADAHIYHWIHTRDANSLAPILESERSALENRIWYTYPGQTTDPVEPSDPTLFEGTNASPAAAVRVISGTTQQAWQYQYTNTANPAALTAMIDPVGRQTNYTYDTATGIDLTGVTQSISGGSAATLESVTYNNTLNPPHCPATVTDAAGQTTSYTYNSQGQVLTVTPPLRAGHSAETTTYAYTGNYLTSITGPLSGATKTFTYDTLNSHTVNRVKTMADAESYTLTYNYDNLDRLTQIAYPDSTTEAFSYLNPLTSAVDLDLHFSTDRVGQTTYRAYDSTRHMTSITDPKTQTTHFTWCSCGSMTSMADAKGNTTYFNYDVESRLTSKVYAGETQPPATPDNTYDTVGRLSTHQDKRGDVATYSYNLDNTVSGVSYSLVTGTAATPNVAYGYDASYNRLTSAGGVSLTYYAPGSLGALKPHVITNTLTGGSAALTYTYDEWRRVVGRNIDSADNETAVFDSLGRITSIANLLCPSGTSFTYSYFDPTHPTNRVGSVSYPNGQSTTFNYVGNTGDERLQEIKNLTPTSAVLSQNDYTYSSDGKIQTWERQTDSNTPLLWTEGYDADDELTSAVLTNTAIASPAVRSDSYAYDNVGNATTFNVSGVSRSPTSNALNQLTGSTPSGTRTVGFTGALNGADTVTVNGTAATVNSSRAFSGTASLTTASTNNLFTVPVVATDAQGNIRTNKYQTTVPGELTYSPTYDADGNELTNGAGQTYTWDAKNEMMSIVYTVGANSGNHTDFAYDTLGRRISIVERTGTTIGSGTITSTKQLVWNGATLAEERNVSNTVTKNFYAQGEMIGTSSYFYSRDHLGSIREMTDSSGNIQARYDYDPYGRASQVQGTLASDFQYAGYYEHATSGLNLTLFRAYDPNTAKWLSRDLLGIAGGINLYGYVGNNPVNKIDSMGLCSEDSNDLADDDNNGPQIPPPPPDLLDPYLPQPFPPPGTPDPTPSDPFIPPPGFSIGGSGGNNIPNTGDPGNFGPIYTIPFP